MSDSMLSEQDRQLLEEITGEDAKEADITDVLDAVRSLSSEVNEVRAELRAHKRNVDHRFSQLDQDTTNKDQGPAILQYTNIPPEDRDQYLSTSEQLAVLMHEFWDEIAWKLGGIGTMHGDNTTSRVGVDTKSTATAKHNPSRLKYRLRQQGNQDLQSTQVYRAMKRLAKLSGGNESTKSDTGRVEIRGGMYEYREKATPDAKGINRVLWRSKDD